MASPPPKFTLIDLGPQFTASWYDHEREPQVPPNPDYPNGVDVTRPSEHKNRAYCTVELPYPAKRCGVFLVKCNVCNVTVGITTAGRPDDPRSVEVVCLTGGHRRKPS